MLTTEQLLIGIILFLLGIILSNMGYVYYENRIKPKKLKNDKVIEEKKDTDDYDPNLKF